MVKYNSEWVIPLLFMLVFAVFCSSAIHTWLPAYGWHDQQRIYQLMLVLFCSLLLVLVPQPALPRMALALLFGIFALGLFSSLLAAWSGWALKEWARFAGLLLVVLCVGGSGWRWPLLIRAVFWLMVGVGVVLSFKFVVAYVAVFASGLHVLDVYLLFSGFSNPRFFGQFQVMFFPILAVTVMHIWRQGYCKSASFLGLVLVIQWCIAFSLGGRGLWLALVVGHLAVLFFNRRVWRLVGLQAVASFLGFMLFFLLFKLAPAYMDAQPILVDGLRATFSNRDQLWKWAWEMVLVNPVLGAGPMHYAAVVTTLAAHPHQVVLQWMAEWGVPATAMAIVLGAWGMSHGGKFLRNGMATEIDTGLWVAIAGALVLAQVDGVFVMPYTETWLAVLVGLALARWAAPLPAGRGQRASFVLLGIPVVGILSLVLIREAPVLPESQAAYILEQHRGGVPRFWEQGWIPMDFK